MTQKQLLRQRSPFPSLETLFLLLLLIPELLSVPLPSRNPPPLPPDVCVLLPPPPLVWRRAKKKPRGVWRRGKKKKKETLKGLFQKGGGTKKGHSVLCVQNFTFYCIRGSYFIKLEGETMKESN